MLKLGITLYVENLYSGLRGEAFAAMSVRWRSVSIVSMNSMDVRCGGSVLVQGTLIWWGYGMFCVNGGRFYGEV